MENQFLIWIDRLKGGQKQKIDESFDSAFLEIQEKELQLGFPVKVTGEAYLSDDELILHLNAKTRAMMPCAICNQMIPIDLAIRDFYHAQPICEIGGAIFDYREPLREALLIELPGYVECNKGNCPDRQSIAPYLRSEKRIKDDIHFPFSNLDS